MGGWVADIHPTCLGIGEKDGTRGEDRVDPDFSPGRNQGTGRDPGPIAHRDRREPKIELFRTVIVVAREQIRALRDRDVTTDVDLTWIVQPGAFADPGMVPDREKPWILDPDSRLEDDSFFDPAAKELQQHDFPGGRPWNPAFEEEHTDNIPGGSFWQRPGIVIPGVIRTEIYLECSLALLIYHAARVRRGHRENHRKFFDYIP